MFLKYVIKSLFERPAAIKEVRKMIFICRVKIQVKMAKSKNDQLKPCSPWARTNRNLKRQISIKKNLTRMTWEEVAPPQTKRKVLPTYTHTLNNKNPRCKTENTGQTPLPSTSKGQTNLKLKDPGTAIPNWCRAKILRVSKCCKI